MMYSLICCISHIIITSVLVLPFLISTHNAQNDPDTYLRCNQYRNIYSPALCDGKPIGGRMDYPFWVKNLQPFDCGLKKFMLSCDHGDLVVDIGSDNKYPVYDINPEKSVLTLLRYGDPLDHICASDEINSTILNTELYNYSNNTEELHLFYDCPADTGTTKIEPNFPCSSDRTKPVYFLTDNLPSQAQQALKDELFECKSTTLPVDRWALKSYMEDPPKPSEYLFKDNFEVSYKINKTACDECVHDSGLCWRETELVNKNTCLYKDGTIHPPYPPSGKNKNPGMINSGAVVGAVIGGSILLLLLFIIYYRWKKIKYDKSLFSQNVFSYSKDVEAFISQYGSSIPQRFRYATLKKITNSFTDEIGKGGYGNVYRGRLADGRVVAVKVLHISKGNGEDFVNEVASIGRTSHVNVVTLLGYCYEGKRQALIYEFMSNGSLCYD